MSTTILTRPIRRRQRNMPNTHVTQTVEHKQKVGEAMATFSNELFKRAVRHDNSKFSLNEAPHFQSVIHKLSELTYGSEEYKKTLGELKPALDNHYKCNDHHPEFYKNGINDMDLMALVEMFCDWWAAVQRHNDGDIRRSIAINKERFGMSDQLTHIFLNTVTSFEKL